MANSTERQQMPLIMKVDRVVVGYLSAVIKADPKMVMVTLRDMGNTVIDRFLSRNSGSRTWAVFSYPGSELRIKVKVGVGTDHVSFKLAQNEWELKFQQATGTVKTKNEMRGSNYYSLLRDWERKGNPNPTHITNYFAVIAEFEIYGRKSYISMTQEEIDTILVENILLAPSEEEDNG